LFKFKNITHTVWVLSFISFFTDIASEMLYPIMPVYFKHIGFSVIFIGILEGFAQATAGVSKGYFGNLSDHLKKRVPFVQLGYFCSAIAKPLMAVFTYPFWVFSFRTLDRAGKGIRTGARDAILATESKPSTKAAVFGFHRSLDTFGAVAGPAIALVFLYFYPEHYRTLIFITLVPGIFAVISSLQIKEPKQTPTINIKKKIHFFGFLKYLSIGTKNYKNLIIGLLTFALFNSSDVFLILLLKYQGLSDSLLISIYIFYNLIYALTSYPIGVLADKIGFKKVFITGLFLFSSVYFSMAFNTNWYLYFIIFAIYGIFAACTEGIGKAWISTLCLKKDLATAIGTFESLKSITTLLSSTLAGIIWFYLSPQILFLSTAIAVFFIAIYFYKFLSIEKFN